MQKQRLFIILFLINISVFCQQKTKRSLRKALQEIERTHKIKFSFSEETIQDKLIEINGENENLTSILSIIEQQTRLIIRKVNDRYYTITKPQGANMEVCGTIYDSKTKELLSNVSILHKTRGISTNESGFFKFKNLKYSDTLTVSYIGYKSVRKAVSDFKIKQCEVIYLEESSDVLNEIIISSYLTNGVVKKTDGSITLRPRKQGILPGQTEADVLLSAQQLPGVQSPIETASGLHIHGGTPDQNLVLFDGIKLYTTAHFFGSISAFNPYVVDNVTVYKNASNTKFGNHIAGVIDVATMQDVPERTQIGFGFNFTNFDIHSLVRVTDKIGAEISFRRSTSDIVNTPTFNTLSQKVFQNTIISEGETLSELPFVEDKNDVSFVDINSKVVYKPNESNKISLQQILIKNDLKYRLTNDQINDIRSDELKIENKGFGITWDKTWGKTLEQETNIYYSNYNLFYDGNIKRDDFIYDFTIKNNTIKDISFSSIIRKKISKKRSINLGYQYTYANVSYNLQKENKVISDEANQFDQQQNNAHTVLAEYVFKDSNKYNLHLGVRSSYLSLLKRFTFEPRLYGKLKVLPGFWLNASAELKQQNTSKVIEFFTSDFGLENELWAISNNDNIPLLKSKQGTLGVIYNRNKWLIDSEFYVKKIDGLTSLTTGFNSFRETIFNGNATIYGVDLLVKKDWNSIFSSWVSYTFGDASLFFNGFNNDKAFKGNFSISNSVYIAQQMSFRSWNFSLGWTWKTGLPFNGLVSLDPNNGLEIEQYNSTDLPSYHRLDASATYSFFWDKKKKVKSKIGISLINIYDQENVLKRVNEVTFDKDFNASINTIDTNAIRFTPNMVFRVEF